MIEVLKLKNEWDELLKAIPQYDFYHTYDYHHISKNNEEVPVLIKYTEGNTIIALPLLIRKIEGTSYYDATSVYGYPGPISRKITKDFDNSNFIKELQESFLNNKIVSVFTRLNPFIPHQEICFKNLGEISTYGIIVNIDLTLGLEAQRKQYRKRLRTYVNKSRRECTVISAKTNEEIMHFINLYYENMLRVKANKQYFFKKEYFFNLINSRDFITEILLAVHKKTRAIIGGSIFIKKNNIVQYHLSGAGSKYLDLNPIKLLIDEMRVIATKENYKYFNLGGGVGSREDSLLKFKKSFSKDFRHFTAWKYIVNEKIYHDLVRQKQEKECVKYYKECSEYFPCYRCNLNNTN